MRPLWHRQDIRGVELWRALSVVSPVRTSTGCFCPQNFIERGRKKRKEKGGKKREKNVAARRVCADLWSLDNSSNVPFPNSTCKCSHMDEQGKLEIPVLTSTDASQAGKTPAPGSRGCWVLPEPPTALDTHQGQHQHTMPFSHPSSLRMCFVFLPPCEAWMSPWSSDDLPCWNKSVKWLLQSSRPPAKGWVFLYILLNGRNWHSSLQAGFWNVYCPLNDSLIFNIMVGWSLILWLKMSIFTADWTCLNGKQFTCIENHINKSTYLLTLKEEGTLYSKAFQFLKLKMSSDELSSFCSFPPNGRLIVVYKTSPCI